MNNFDEITKDFVKWLDTLDEDSIIRIQQKEIERLTELCNKYEEEHKTTFETWQKDIKENEQLHSIIKEVREYIEKYLIQNDITLQDYQNKYKELINILDKVGEE